MATGGGSGNGGGGGHGGANTQNQPWAWLGLLKWTLAHQGGDGTVPSEDSPTLQQLSDEDKAFLETVMADGIVDEGERMHVILQQFSIAMEYYQTKQQQQAAAAAAAATESAAELGTGGENEATTEETTTEPSIDGVPPPNTEEIEDLLQELRDIVEQIDYARGFVNMKGCQYLLGAIGVPVPVIPTGIRNLCLGIMATLAQNNPPVQKEFVELGAIKVLSNMLLPEERMNDDDNDNDDGVVPFPLSTKVKIMQALSAIVRCYDVTESVFEALPQAPSILCEGLVSSSWSLQLKTLFFMRAFLTSDTATNTRAVRFRNAIAIVANTDAAWSYLKCGLKTSTADEDADKDGTRTNNSNAYLAMQIRESSIELLQQLLQRQFAVALLLEQKHHLAAFGVQRIQTLRSLTTTNKNNDDDNTDDDKESTKQELHKWESFLIQLARTVPEK